MGAVAAAAVVVVVAVPSTGATVCGSKTLHKQNPLVLN